MNTVPHHIREQALAIAEQALAIADGDVAASLHSAVLRLEENVDTLKAWTHGLPE